MWTVPAPLIIDGTMGQGRTILLEEIGRLLNSPRDGEDAPSLERLEHTLTDGYAHALALEAERARLQQRIGELAGDVEPDTRRRDHELSTLAERLRTSEGELSRLRGTLALLRVRAASTRAAAAPSAA